jgi:phage gpG-like protein
MYKSGKLMRSIKKTRETMAQVIVEADSEYADIHNSGGTITVTAQMKKYFWARYYESAGKTTITKTGSQSRSRKNVALNNKAAFFKRMALMPVGSKIKIPKRQFMGDSQALMKNFDEWFGETVRSQVEPQFNNPTVTIQQTTI